MSKKPAEATTLDLPEYPTLDDLVKVFPFIPRQTWYHWRTIGQGPKSAKLGRRVVYRRNDVEEWVAEAFAGAGE